MNSSDSSNVLLEEACQFKSALCDAGYVGFTRRHLHQRVDEHRHTSSSIGKHFRDKHSSSVHSYYTLCHNNQSVIIELNA